MGFKFCVRKQVDSAKVAPFCLIQLLITLAIAVLVLTIIFIAKVSTYNELKDQGNPGVVGVVTQLVEDWQTVPFISIQVTDTGECPPGSDPVFFSEWKGTEPGCFIADGDSCGKDCTIPFGGGSTEPASGFCYDDREIQP